MRSRLLLLSWLPLTMAADTCLSQPQLLGVVFGSVAAALFIASAVAVILWLCMRKQSEEQKKLEKSAYTNTSLDVEEKGCDAPSKIGNKDQMTMIDSFTLRRKLLDTGTQKSYSSEHINEVDAQVGVQLKSDDLGGLGFNIQGNMTEGIFVKNVHPKGPAELCGNIIAGDRIKSLTINFESMVYEDAVTILSYASPYKVKLELERKLEDSSTPTVETGSPRLHPLFRSNTLTNIHFNPVSCQPARATSVETTQRHALPEKEERVTSPIMTSPKVTSDSPVSQLPDSTTGNEHGSEADESRLISSDYASDNTSDYRESISDAATGTESVGSTEEISQSTLSDRIEITDLIVDKPLVSPTPPPHRVEYCNALPPRPKKVVERSPSPKMTRKAPTPPPPAPQPVPVVAETKIQMEMVVPLPEPSPLPMKREQSKSRIPPPSPPRGPEITEARISRIPKRTESSRTPVLERKLPTLPRSITQRSHSAEDKSGDNVWSRLYQEKKGTLRKVREPGQAVQGSLSPVVSPQPPMSPEGRRRELSPLNSPHSFNSPLGRELNSFNSPRGRDLSPHLSPPPHHNSPRQSQPSRIPGKNSAIQRTPSSDRYATLSRDRRERLAANEDTLQRQRNELRELGLDV